MGARSRLGTDIQTTQELASEMLSNYTANEKMRMGVQFEKEQIGLAETQGNYATHLQMRAFDANGKLLPGAVFLDMAGFNAEGQFAATEFKLSINSPLTIRQSEHFPNFALYGGLVTGYAGGEISLPKGRVIAPFNVNLEYAGPHTSQR